ncbi:preprotein translocase subunit SECE1 [Carica papaya]|uniref:preprotein translocase subunit SECE1 n=1 Tax=Carica papaya TaxID=3649 RepID=UPI000B8CF397|nr:preprotein translocase subunit SECE1 [Carica papaya]XP_021906958.1 preprotein translocase subunit SECE1 [Carica papaya]
MALSIQFLVASTKPTTLHASIEFKKLPGAPHSFPLVSKIKPLAIRSERSRSTITEAVEKSGEGTGPEVEVQSGEEPVASRGASDSEAELTEVGAEIKRVLEKRKEEKEGDLLSGVAEEVREIEWPAFGKVLGTTGVVLGVIAGSSIVLLTVNAIFAELSDRVFASKGIQDFFS